MHGRFLVFAIALVGLAAAAGHGAAAELVMFETDSCEWCQRWHAEIGVIYAKTDEARIAPLRRVGIEDPVPADLEHVRGIRYTPTFVLMEDGEEVGRILGYPGEEFFWALLSIEIEKLELRRAARQARPGGSQCAVDKDGEEENATTDRRAAAC